MPSALLDMGAPYLCLHEVCAATLDIAGPWPFLIIENSAEISRAFPDVRSSKATPATHPIVVQHFSLLSKPLQQSS